MGVGQCARSELNPAARLPPRSSTCRRRCPCVDGPSSSWQRASIPRQRHRQRAADGPRGWRPGPLRAEGGKSQGAKRLAYDAERNDHGRFRAEPAIGGHIDGAGREIGEEPLEPSQPWTFR